MMNEHELRGQLHRAAKTRLSSLEPNPWLTQRILATARGETKVKAKRPVSVLLAIVIMLAVAGAVAAAVHWNVVDFLFGRPNPQAAFLVKNIEVQTSDGQVTLMVNSALCDGEMLALDWTVRNSKPEQPVYLQIERFDVNDMKLEPDWNDSFHYQWLPGWCNDGTMQGGESILLPDELTDDLMTVEMTAGVYRPQKPIYLMDAYDEEEAKQKTAEGYFVLAEGDGFVLPDPETGGLMRCFGGIGDNELSEYNSTELTLSFDLNLSAARAAGHELMPQSSYSWKGLTARYTIARITPAALYLTLEATGGGEDQYDELILDGRFELTDGEGNPFEHPWGQSETGKEELSDGTMVLRSTHQWVGITADELPDTLSLTYISNDESIKQVFPFKLE